MPLLASSCFPFNGHIVSTAFLLIRIVKSHAEKNPEQGGNRTMAVHGPDYPPTYFGLADYRGLIYGHVSLMILAWVFVLPIGKYILGEAPMFWKGRRDMSPPVSMNYRFGM